MVEQRGADRASSSRPNAPIPWLPTTINQACWDDKRRHNITPIRWAHLRRLDSPAAGERSRACAWVDLLCCPLPPVIYCALAFTASRQPQGNNVQQG